MKKRIDKLSDAITKYGDASIEVADRVKNAGNLIVSQMPGFLGDGAIVFGVPPVGDWKPSDYRDAKFSFHGAGFLEVEPIQMGLAIGIPHIKDEGMHWVRVAIEFAPINEGLEVSVDGDTAVANISSADPQAGIEESMQLVFNYLFSLFDGPVTLANRSQLSKIGFANPKSKL